MQLSKNDIESLSLLHIPKDMRTTDKLFLRDGILYKLFGDNSFIDEKNRNVDFLIQNRVPNSPEIYAKLYRESEFCGYTMEYLSNSLTFRQAITDIYEAMKFFHSYDICLGDIHSDNMLITNGKGYLIDLEEIRFPGDEFKFKQCYLVRPNESLNKINIPSKYTDNVKLMICSLSLLLNRDLETFIDPIRHEINLEKLYNDIILPLNNEELSSYFKELMSGNFKEYFSDFLGKSMKNNKKKLVQHLRTNFFSNLPNSKSMKKRLSFMV